jgi:hypothetical protein
MAPNAPEEIRREPKALKKSFPLMPNGPAHSKRVPTQKVMACASKTRGDGRPAVAGIILGKPIGTRVTNKWCTHQELNLKPADP